MKGETTLLKEVMYFLLAMFLIFTVIVAFSRVVSMITGDTAQVKADATLERLDSFTRALQEGESQVFVLYTPEDYYLVSFSSSSDAPSDVFGKNSVCICNKEDCKSGAYCREFEMPIYRNDFLIKEKISIRNLMIYREKDRFVLLDAIQDVAEGESSTNLTVCSGELITVQGEFQLKEGAANAFQEAKRLALAEKIDLKVASAYRTFKEQEELWAKYDKNSDYACNPGTAESPNQNCPHMVGCAVDICFGSLCNEGAFKANALNDQTKKLEEIMAKAGFIRYSKEWWHFEYGTERWARAKAEGLTSIA